MCCRSIRVTCEARGRAGSSGASTRFSRTALSTSAFGCLRRLPVTGLTIRYSVEQGRPVPTSSVSGEW